MEAPLYGGSPPLGFSTRSVLNRRECANSHGDGIICAPECTSPQGALESIERIVLHILSIGRFTRTT